MRKKDEEICINLIATQRCINVIDFNHQSIIHKILSNMRTFIAALTTLAVMLSTASCISLLEPEHAESSYLKGWIFRNCIDDSYMESCIKDFGAALYDFSFSTSPQTLQEACLDFFLANNYYTGYFKGSYKKGREDMLEEVERIFDGSYLGRYDDNTIKIFKQDPEATRTMVVSMLNEFFAYIENLAEDEVKMLNWTLNEDALADTYTGYFVEYEIGSGFYALLDLVEYDNEDRYTWELVYSGNSLSELHQYYK